jgi:hypothetical protein
VGFGEEDWVMHDQMERLSQKDELLAQMRRRMDAALAENARLRVALEPFVRHNESEPWLPWLLRVEPEWVKQARTALAGTAEPSTEYQRGFAAGAASVVDAMPEIKRGIESQA